MKQSNELSSPHHTCTMNALKHSGIPNAPSQCQSHAKKVADDAQHSQLQAAPEVNALLTLANITSTEEAMGVFQQVKCTAVKKGVCPFKPRMIKNRAAAAVVPKGACTFLNESKC